MENFIKDPIESKKGRIIILLFFALFILLSMYNIKPTPIFYVFILYCLSQGYVVYKSWGAYYDFAKYYRKKLNPNFPLTPKEHTEFYGGISDQPFNTYHFYGLVWANYEDKKLKALAKKTKLLTIINFSLPIICFIVSIIVVNTFGWD